MANAMYRSKLSQIKLRAILKNNREKEKHLVATSIFREMGIDEISVSPARRAGCLSIMFLTIRITNTCR
jgi:hypothetical protein